MKTRRIVIEQKEEKTVLNFKRLLRFSGLFNIIAASLFIFPKVYEYYILFYNKLNGLFMLGGNDITIPTDAFHALFINTAGIDLVLIGSFVLIASSNPLNRTNRRIILLNGVGRFLFTIITVYYGVTMELIGIFVLIGVIDFFITSSFLYYLSKTKQYVE